MRFFFYGTLIAGSANPVAERIHGRLLDLGPATAAGRLYAIPTGQGWYPAFIAEPDGEGEVHGVAYETLPGFTAADLALLDDYEAYYPDRPEASEYRREQIDIACGGREEPAEAYVYRAALPEDARTLPHGSFREFLAGTGAPPYRVSPDELGGLLERRRRD